MIDSRRKGRLGEQELARLLRDELGETITRNWQAQSAEGGCDLAGLTGFAVECKRYASATYADLERWWTQTVRQARPGETPVLAYREDRCPWRFVIPGDEKQTFAMSREVSASAFVEIVRRSQRGTDA